MDLTEFQAKQARELAEFKAQQETKARVIALGAPEPLSVGKLYGATTAYFSNRDGRTLAEAVELLKLFPVVPFNILKDGTTTLLYPDVYRAGDYLASVDVNYSRDNISNTSAKLSFYAVSAKLSFYAVVGGELFKVGIDFGTGYNGSAPEFTPVAVESYGYRNRVQSRTYEANREWGNKARTVINFGTWETGPVKTSAHHCYLFADLEKLA